MEVSFLTTEGARMALTQGEGRAWSGAPSTAGKLLKELVLPSRAAETCKTGR